MRTLAIIALIGVVSVASHGQGKVAFGTVGASVQPNLITYDGIRNLGPGILAALYWASASVSDESSFFQVGPPTTLFGNTGLILPVERLVPQAGPGNFQIRAWESAFGASYEEAFATGGAVGRSAIFAASAVDANNVLATPTSLVAAANAAGIPMGFQFCLCPEPSGAALGLLATGVFVSLGVTGKRKFRAWKI